MVVLAGRGVWVVLGGFETGFFWDRYGKGVVAWKTVVARVGVVVRWLEVQPCHCAEFHRYLFMGINCHTPPSSKPFRCQA